MTLSKELNKRLSEIEEKRGSPSAEQIEAVVRSIMSTIEGGISPLDLKVHAELESLAKHIQDTRLEIAGLRPADINDQHIPTATDELSAVVGATEDATQKILDCAETISQIAEKVDSEIAVQLLDVTTRIFEASNFQDITGQRITKVVKTLQHIESKIDDLLKVLGHERVVNGKSSAKPIDSADVKNMDEKDLLNGPQLPTNAASQEEIDRLLASFD